jgi:hypothetical protein
MQSAFQQSQATIDNKTDIKGGLIMTAVTIVLCVPVMVLVFNNITKHFG